ncbi:hypothetical protein B9G55_09380 [Saccharibacillus sp. O16]|nr:hypothetical protein B9G55_09380 [Saccharibacillus sp. O16]
MKRKIFSLLAASALLVTVPIVAEASPGKVDRPVNLRSAPSASEGSVYRTLQPGTKLEVLAESNAYWLKVQAGDKVGYVSASYITYAKSAKGDTASSASPAASSSQVSTPPASPSKAPAAVKPAASPAPAVSPVKTSTEPAAPASPSVQPTGSGTVTKNVNFRAEPVTGSDVYRVLSAGETFAAVELTNSAWLKITDASGVTGYVSTSYVNYTLADGSTNANASVPTETSSPTTPPPASTVTPQPDAGSTVPVDPSLILPPPTIPSVGVVGAEAADQVLANALSLQGITHYGFGKNVAPVLFDCSSFTRYVFGQVGVDIPVGTAYQKDVGIAVDKDDWQKGDLLFFWSSVPGLIGHVGIYDGEGHLVHNSSSKDGVAVADLSLKYWQDHYVSARRVLQ